MVQRVGILAVSVLLAGSLLGSLASFLFGRRDPVPAESYQDPYANWRPAHQESQFDVKNARHRPARNRSVVSLLVLAAIAFGATSAALFSYKSPWPTGTDLRHLAAALHCDIADRVGLAPASQGAPGYHARNDRDGNGISCETGPASLASLAPVGGADKLSDTAITWPAAAATQ